MSGVGFVVSVKPVSTNATYRRGAGKRLYKTDEAVIFWTLLQLGARVAMKGRPPLRGSVEARIRFVFDSRRPDIDGAIKPVLDAMQGIVYANDRQVRRLTVDRDVDKDHPRVELAFREVTP